MQKQWRMKILLSGKVNKLEYWNINICKMTGYHNQQQNSDMMASPS